jgi:hypothetical protein
MNQILEHSVRLTVFVKNLKKNYSPIKMISDVKKNHKMQLNTYECVENASKKSKKEETLNNLIILLKTLRIEPQTFNLCLIIF